MGNATSGRVTWVENLRATATIAVILIHVSAPFVNETLGTSTAFNSIFWDAAARFCVPVFVMLTGALLLDRVMPLEVFFAKRFSRVFVPFVAWTIVYLIYHFITEYQAGGISSPILAAQFFAQKLLRGADYHLWYVYMLVGLYLLLPLLSRALQSLS